MEDTPPPCFALLSVGFHKTVWDLGGARPQGCRGDNSITAVSCSRQSNDRGVTVSSGDHRTLELVSLIIGKPHQQVPFSKKVWEQGIL